MNRNTVNFIRNILENWIPASVRDSFLFYPLLFLVFGKRTKYYAEFRQKVPFLTLNEYAKYYENFPHVMGETDLNKPCLEEILNNVTGTQILDAGCGRGFLARTIKNSNPSRSVTGIDIQVSANLKSDSSIKFVEGFVEKLPFADKSFDTVTCTHTLEHVLNMDLVLAELRRVAKNRLIIVVPKEREYLYSFNLHINFFPYTHSFLKVVSARNFNHVCKDLDGDIYYQETYS